MTPEKDQIRSNGSETLSLPDNSLCRESHVLFGPLGRDTYLKYAPAAPNNPDYAIEKLSATFGSLAGEPDAAVRQERIDMWTRYERLLAALDGGAGELVDAVYDFLVRESALAAQQLSEPRTGLGRHLQEVSEFCSQFLLNDAGASRFLALLSDRQAALVAQVAAPLHDALKYLGTPAAQIMPDHEIMTAELVRRSFPNKLVRLNGIPTPLAPEDAEFVAAILGDHENVEKEAGRSERIHSLLAADRAKALFFVADVLTGAIVQERENHWRFDQVQLEKRFVDLYFRHIDPLEGKIFRPEWGAATVADLVSTFTALLEHGCAVRGRQPAMSVPHTLVETGLAAIERACSAEGARLLTNAQRTRIADARLAIMALLKE